MRRKDETTIERTYWSGDFETAEVQKARAACVDADRGKAGESRP